MTHQTMSDRTDRATARPTHGANTDTPFTRPEKVRAVPLEELAEAFAEFNRGTRRARWADNFTRDDPAERSGEHE